MSDSDSQETADMLPAFPVIVGATASGKSSLAMELARWLRSERSTESVIVSMDSMMVYRLMDIGTAKPTKNDLEEFPHACIDVVDPCESFSVKEWLNQARLAIEEARSAGAVPIVVGGTHLYAIALVQGLVETPAADEDLRVALRQLDAVELRARLLEVDPGAADRIHPNDTRRTIRAIEVAAQSGQALSDQQTQWEGAGEGLQGATPFALQWETSELNQRINARVRQMMEQGLHDEVRSIAQGAGGGFGNQSCEALGYKQLLLHIDGQLSEKEAVERIKVETRRFGKNQRTWLRKLILRYGAVSLEGANPAQSLNRLKQLFAG